MALIWFGIFTCVGVADRAAARERGPARRARPRAGDGPARDDGPLGRPVAALHGLERAHRRDVPGDGLLRVRPEPGAAVPLRAHAHREPPVSAVQRVPQGPDAVPHPADGRPRVRVLPLPRDAAPLEPRRAGTARGESPGGRARERAPRGAGRACGPRRCRVRLRRRPPRRRRRDRTRPGRLRRGPGTPRRRGARRARARVAVRRREGERRQLHLPELRRVAPARRPRRPRARRDLRGGDVDARRGAELARDRDDGRLLPAVRAAGSERVARPLRVARLHRVLGRVRGGGRDTCRAARLGDRGREPLRLVLLRLDPRRLRARDPDAARHGARGLLGALRRHGDGVRRLADDRGRVPLVQRDRRRDGVRRRPRDHGDGPGAAPAGAATRPPNGCRPRASDGSDTEPRAGASPWRRRCASNVRGRAVRWSRARECCAPAGPRQGPTSRFLPTQQRLAGRLPFRL